MALERADIIKAAIALLDEEGLEAVSTRKVAARLGVAGPSLYWHFKSMRELIDHMAEEIMAQTMPSPEHYRGAWQDWLAAGARSIRKAALSHRDGARVISGSKPTGTHPVMNLRAMNKRLEDSGFSAADARRAISVLGHYALGWALNEQNVAGGRAVARDSAGFEFGLSAMLIGIESHLHASKRKRRVGA